MRLEAESEMDVADKPAGAIQVTPDGASLFLARARPPPFSEPGKKKPKHAKMGA